MGLCSSSNVKSETKHRTNNPAHENACTDRALRVEPGSYSFSDAVKKAKEQDINCLFLKSGVYTIDYNDEDREDCNCNTVTIDFALEVIGQNKDDVQIRASLEIYGEEEEDVSFSDVTVTGTTFFKCRAAPCLW